MNEPHESDAEKTADRIPEKPAKPISEKRSDPITANPPVQRGTANKAIVLSVVALLIGVIALALAIIPALALGRPLPNPFAEEAAPEPPATEPTTPDSPDDEREGGITLKYKSVSVTFGGKKKEDKDDEEDEAGQAAEPVPREQPKPETKAQADPVRWFTLTAVVAALVGLVLAPIAQVKEKHPAMTIGAVMLCVGAITWQYFAVGIAIGAGVAACLIVLAILGQFVS
jgi:hypothetical protein